MLGSLQVHGWIPRTPSYKRSGRQMLWHLTSTARCEHCTVTPPQRHSAVNLACEVHRISTAAKVISMSFCRCEDESIDELAAYVGAGTAVAALTKRCVVANGSSLPSIEGLHDARLKALHLLPMQRHGGHYELPRGAAGTSGAHQCVPCNRGGVSSRSSTATQPRQA